MTSFALWPDRDPPPRSPQRFYNAYAIAISLGLGQNARARELCEAGLALARAAGDEPLVFALEIRLALVLDYMGDAPAARRVLDTAEAHPLAVKEAASPLVGNDAAAFVGGYRGAVALQEGRLDDALRAVEWGVERARAKGATEVLGWLLGMSTDLWITSGDLSRASRSASESLEIAERIESPLSRTIATGALARVRLEEIESQLITSQA